MSIFFANSLFIKGKNNYIDRLTTSVSHKKEIENII